MEPIDLSGLVGLDVAAAQRLVQGKGFLFRVVEEDGVSLARTADYRLDRVNVVVAADKVARADIG
jgi:hypothetical protein